MISALLLSLALNSCATTDTENAGVTESPFHDKAYFPVYESHTRDYDIIQNFLTNLKISTTLIDQDFVDAFSDRYEKIFKEKNKFIKAPERNTA